MAGKKKKNTNTNTNTKNKTKKRKKNKKRKKKKRFAPPTLLSDFSASAQNFCGNKSDAGESKKRTDSLDQSGLSVIFVLSDLRDIISDAESRSNACGDLFASCHVVVGDGSSDCGEDHAGNVL